VDKQGGGPEARDADEGETVLGEISARLGFRDALRRNRVLDISYRTGVAVVGLGIVALGIVLLPLPGPGWLVIFAGLFVLSTEFEWAERLLTYARRQVHGWTQWVAAQSALVRAGIALGCLLVVAGALWGYLAWRGVPGWIPLIG
jgi:uncharacterized protein (TIGR02611 family)